MRFEGMATITYLRCQDCGCHCESCHSNNSLHLHKEIEDLKRQVLEREYHILQMETNVMVAADKYPNGEYAALSDEMHLCQDKYDRLLESHRKLQRVNQGLEDKLLKIVDKYETEKAVLNRDLASLTSRLVEARVSLAQLEEENEQYRNDCNIAIQLLQCKPSNFVSHKLDSFPVDFQHKAKQLLNIRKLDQGIKDPNCHLPEVRTIRVPIPTFPPTAMVYSVNEGDVTHNMKSAATLSATNENVPANDIVSAAIMAKVLEERAKERSTVNGCCCCCCSNGRRVVSCACKCGATKRCSKDTDSSVNHVSCQTQWSIDPDAVLKGGRVEAAVPCACRTLPGAAAVHTQRWHVDSSSSASMDAFSAKRWQRSGSTTSTETEI